MTLRSGRRFRALIVDDEPLGRERIRSLLEAEDDVEVVGECSDGNAAVEAVQQIAPDLVFLDIHMPGMSGLQVVEEVGVQRMPVTIFVTAYDQHAIQAFEANAIDYLLKPFDRDRFRRTLQRARSHIERVDALSLSRKLDHLLEQVGDRGSEYLQRLVIRTGPRMTVLDVGEINWFAAEGNYVRVHIGGKSHLARETMSTLEDSLDPSVFVRIHRSTIVRIQYIAELESIVQGEYLVVLRNGVRLTSSRTYRESLERAMRIAG